MVPVACCVIEFMKKTDLSMNYRQLSDVHSILPDRCLSLPILSTPFSGLNCCTVARVA